jgi:hypothetical protein
MAAQDEEDTLPSAFDRSFATFGRLSHTNQEHIYKWGIGYVSVGGARPSRKLPILVAQYANKPTAELVSLSANEQHLRQTWRAVGPVIACTARNAEGETTHVEVVLGTDLGHAEDGPVRVVLLTKTGESPAIYFRVSHIKCPHRARASNEIYPLRAHFARAARARAREFLEYRYFGTLEYLFFQNIDILVL